jgi:putative transposase
VLTKVALLPKNRFFGNSVCSRPVLLSIERMCELARVSRASFYGALKEPVPAEEEMEVRSAVQQIALEHRRRYGYRRISAELRRRGMQVNHLNGP